MKKFLTMPYILTAELIFIYGMIFAIPILIIPGIFIIIPSMVVIAKKFGLIVPFAEYALFLIISFIFNYNILIVLSTAAIVTTVLSLHFALKRTKNYIIMACTAVVAVLVSILSAIAGYCAIYRRTPQDAVRLYIENSTADIVIVEIARFTILEHADSNTQREISVMPPDPEINLSKIQASQSPNRDTIDAVNYLAYIVFLDLETALSEYILRFIISLALLSFFLSYLCIPYKCTFDEHEKIIAGYLKEKKDNYDLNAEIIAKCGRLPISRLEIPRIYFALTFFPLMAFMLFSTNATAGIFAGTMLTALCLIPFAFAGYTLCLFFTDCFADSIPKLIAKIILTIFFSLCFFIDLAVVIFSIIGVADAIVHTRRIMDKLLYT